ncbi:MAG: cysteine desulfurase [Chloroflexi bacterium]|nr:MAG: cysteine desulfurase [Chloroflexota bacterium]MBL1195791.1 cysteine desulfurase [Chloroflexota bacterium]
MTSPDTTKLDFEKIRADFPILEREVKPGVPLIYLDSTASSQKPRQVIDAMTAYYELQNANVHRGVHALSEEATEAYEGARQRIADFINAASAQEIIYTRNTTESINLVAFSWGRSNLTKGDVIVLTEMEHHSNIVPWQMLAAELDLRLEFIPVTEDGLLEMEEYHKLLELKPKIVAFAHMSNVLGTINPAKEIIELAHSAGAITVVDAAQSVPHFAVDIQDLDADFYAFSGHKMLGPTGIGILYGKKDLLKAMPPFLGGGDMIKRVELRSFIANELPHKFEAGTPAIAEAIGLGAAVDYLNEVGMDAIFAHEAQLTEYALERLEEVPGVWLFGPSADKKGGVASFTFEGVHPHDVSEILDRSGVAVRAGHHCAMPLHNKFNINATARASFYLYNTESDVDRLIEGLYKVKEVYG